MKKSNLNSLTIAAAAALIGFVSPNASAVTLTYDADTTPPVTDGAGVWNTTTANWFDGTNDVLWANTTLDTAIFGNGGTIANAAAGTVTVGTVNVGLITFGTTVTTGYTLSPAAGSITLGTGITTTNTLNSTISAKISGASGLAFNGVANAANGLTLSGANDYTGITSLSTGGRITTGNATAFGSSAGATASTLGTNYTLVNTGTTAALANSTSEAFLINGTGSTPSGNPNGAIRFGAALTLSSLVQLGSSSQITNNGSGPVTISGNLDLGAFNLGVGNGSLAFNTASAALTVSGLVTGTSASVLDIGAGGGTNLVNLTNNGNTYSGITRVNASSGTSTVGLGGDTVLGTSTLSFNGGGVQSTDSTARTIANTFTVGSNATFGQTTTQTGALNFTYNTAAVSLGATAKTFTTNVNTTFAAAFSSSSNLTKAGAATLTFGGDSSARTGTTTVNAGTLLVTNTAGSGTGTGAVTVNTTASLGGTGIIGGSTTISSGGSLNAGLAGSTTGVLAFSNVASTLTLAGTTTFDLNGGIVRGTNFDGINVAGNLLNGGALVFNITTALANTTYDLFSLASQSGDFTSVTLTGAGYTISSPFVNSSGTWSASATDGTTFTYVQSTGDLTLAIPEPSTYALIIGGAGLMFLIVRSRRRAA